jgi:hypothetical protein
MARRNRRAKKFNLNRCGAFLSFLDGSGPQVVCRAGVWLRAAAEVLCFVGACEDCSLLCLHLSGMGSGSQVVLGDGFEA